METIDCIFCGPNAKPDPIVIRENGFEGRQCQSCQLIYISPRPSMDEIANLYAHDEAKTGAAVLRKGEYSRRLAAKHTLRMLRSEKQSGTLLEIGAGMVFFVTKPSPQDTSLMRSNSIQSKRNIARVWASPHAASH